MSEFLASHGSYLLITIFLILTGAGLPIPEEVPIIVAGGLSAGDQLNPWIALGCCLFGAVVGDMIMYWIGYHFGRGVLRDHRWFARFVTPEREEQIEENFRLHGFKVFFLARFLVGIRSPVYLTAGILRVSFRRYFLIDLVCATAVVGTFFGLTYFFGAYVPQLIHEAEWWVTVCVVIGLAIVAFFLWRRYRKKKGPDAGITAQAEIPCSPPKKEPSVDHQKAETQKMAAKV
jgi:membrane protein DedA with SNARE-associated domain